MWKPERARNILKFVGYMVAVAVLWGVLAAASGIDLLLGPSLYMIASILVGALAAGVYPGEWP